MQEKKKTFLKNKIKTNLPYGEHSRPICQYSLLVMRNKNYFTIPFVIIHIGINRKRCNTLKT